MPKPDLEKKRYWQERVDAWQVSGLSAARWCRENNESQCQFDYWKKQLWQKAEQESDAGFTELSTDTARDSETGLELHLGQVAIYLRRDFDAPSLGRVLHLLGELS